MNSTDSFSKRPYQAHLSVSSNFFVTQKQKPGQKHLKSLDSVYSSTDNNLMSLISMKSGEKRESRPRFNS